MIEFIRLLIVRVAKLFEVLSLLFIPFEVVNFCALFSSDQSPSVVIINKVDRNFFSVITSFILQSLPVFKKRQGVRSHLWEK